MSDDDEWQPPEEGPLLSLGAQEVTIQIGLPESAGCPDDLRAKGWTVAVHNDYEQDGERFTFWLMTKKDSNIALKGEGKTDAEALNQIREQVLGLSSQLDDLLNAEVVRLKGALVQIEEARNVKQAQLIARKALEERAECVPGESWWRGVFDLAEAVGATIDEYGDDIEGAASRLGGLLDAVGRRDDPSTWDQYKAADVCECERPELRGGRCLICGGTWSPDDNDEEP